MTRSYFSLMVLSNIPILIAAVLAYRMGWRTNAVIYLVAAIVSIIYHRSHETRYKKIDIGMASMLFLGNVVRFVDYPGYVTGLCSAASLACYMSCSGCEKNYEWYHPLWHLTAGAGTMLLYTNFPVGTVMTTV
jgi:hypothetical protein